MPGDPSDARPPGMPLADWRRRRQEQRVPIQLRERLATTAELVAQTFELGAQIRASMAARGGPMESYYRSRAGWNQMVADFERRQASALRDGRLLATPWRPAPKGRDR